MFQEILFDTSVEIGVFLTWLVHFHTCIEKSYYYHFVSLHFLFQTKYLSATSGEGGKAALNNFNKIFSKDLQGDMNLEDKGTSIQSHPHILSLIHSASRLLYGTYSEKNANEMFKTSLGNAREKKRNYDKNKEKSKQSGKCKWSIIDKVGWHY